MSRLSRQYHEEDLEKRDGRRSWRQIKEVLDENPQLFAVPTNIIRRKAKP